MRAEDVGSSPRSTSWIDPFLEANRLQLDRLGLRPETHVDRDGPAVWLHPSARIGAVPLLAPATRRPAAGLVVRPRFGWTSLGEVLGGVGFDVEPRVGGGPLVPGSAREVPPWILAGPVVERLRGVLDRLGRRFEWTTAERAQPRGHVDWADYARRRVPAGRWDRFRCSYPDLARHPDLLAAVRWTLGRLELDLAGRADSALGRWLTGEVQHLLHRAGPGPSRRPTPDDRRRLAGEGPSEHLRTAVEAMGWVAEERGLGGARTLDGLAWSLPIDALWEAWVEHLLADLAPRVGARLRRRGEARWPLAWRTPTRSLGSLAPDLALEWPEHTVWVDAKYKPHLLQLRRLGWANLSAEARRAHRADVHQALAYAALADTPSVDTVLAYPWPTTADEPPDPPTAIAEVGLASSRRVRLLLAGLPFGSLGETRGDTLLEGWRIGIDEREP